MAAARRSGARVTLPVLGRVEAHAALAQQLEDGDVPMPRRVHEEIVVALEEARELVQRPRGERSRAEEGGAPQLGARGLGVAGGREERGGREAEGEEVCARLGRVVPTGDRRHHQAEHVAAEHAQEGGRLLRIVRRAP